MGRKLLTRKQRPTPTGVDGEERAFTHLFGWANQLKTMNMIPVSRNPPTEPEFSVGQKIVTKRPMKITMWGQRYTVIDRSVLEIVAIEPQGYLLSDGLYCPKCWIEPIP